MRFHIIQDHLKGIPYILPELAENLYHFILDQKPHHCLELGFGHGVSSCYIAAALEEIGSGHLTTVDLLPAQEWQHPAIETLLAQTCLEQFVSIEREATSYTCFLQKEIYKQSSNNHCATIYDFCFIDGAKNWTIDSSAFFLVDKLLNQNGWILFDDLQWTYRSKIEEGKTKSDGISLHSLSEDELDKPHIELIYQLLVMQHPSYSNFHIKDYWWTWAQKTSLGSRDATMEVSEKCKMLISKWEQKHGRKYRPPFTPFDQ